MKAYERISKAFERPLVLPLEKGSRYILMSDCHRGVGNGNDNFLKNEYLYVAALKYYYQKGFTYIELGDGDELWENRSINGIKEMHTRTFDLLGEYYRKGRLYTLYGNHDMIKRRVNRLRKHLSSYYCAEKMCSRPLFPGITFYSGAVLKDQEGKKDIYLTHGHQADALNSTFWQLSRFLVRYVWKPLEGLGIPDPTSAAKNNTKKKKSETILADWARRNQKILVAGHTHHPMLGSKNSPYFNTGSCIHPTGITGIEIENRCLTLVKWSVEADDTMALYASREVFGEKFCLEK